MASTAYTLFINDEAQEKTFSVKAKAVAAAEAARKELKLPVRVETGSGTVVFSMKARKPQVKTKPYTRTVELPADVEIPAGPRVAYTRARKNAAILHDPSLPKGEQYSVVRYDNGEVLAEGLATTRACGRFLADEVPLPAKETVDA